MKKTTFITLFALFIAFSGFSQTYTTGTVSLSSTVNFTVQFDIDTTDDTISMTMVGDSDVWLGVAPGVAQGNGMGNLGDDTIIFSDDGLEDRNMPSGTGQPNLDSQQDWSVVSNDVANGIRTIVANRALTTGDSNDYVFPESETSFPLLWAFGNNSLDLSYHGSGRGGTVVNTTLSNAAFEVAKLSFDVFPNPSSDELNISFSSHQIPENSNLEIYNTLGKRLFSQPVSDLNTKINVSNWNTGIYLIKVSNGGSVQTKRFIKN